MEKGGRSHFFYLGEQLFASSAEYLQGIVVAINQSLFLLSCPTFDLALTTDRSNSRCVMFRIYQADRKTFRRVRRTITPVVGLESFPDISGVPDIERIVRAAEDVDVIHGPFSEETAGPEIISLP